MGYFFLSIASLLTNGALGEQTLPAHYATYAVQISVGPSSGSGFFLLASNSVFLVSARHVLFNDRDKAQCPNYPAWGAIATCRTFAEEPSGTNIARRIIELDLLKLLAFREARYLTNHDVAMVRLEKCSPADERLVLPCAGVTFKAAGPLSPFAYKDTRRLEDIPIARDILLFGYPASIGLANIPQIDQDYPLLRRGIVAGFNRSRGTVILDCASYQGDSGGPVIAVEHPNLNVTSMPIIGILTEWVPFQDIWENKRFGYYNQSLMNSGYSVMEPIDVISNLLDDWR